MCSAYNLLLLLLFDLKKYAAVFNIKEKKTIRHNNSYVFKLQII